MKQIKHLAISSLIFFSCQSEPSKTADLKDESISIEAQKTLMVPWAVQVNDSTNALEIRRDANANIINLQPEDMVDALNLKYPEIKLTWIRLEGNKAFVAIQDASYLTQQSGSEGAQAYLAEVTYSLTELAGIAAVNFSFEEGDHAQPGVYTRDSFNFK
jgi:spore germination protein GerM